MSNELTSLFPGLYYLVPCLRKQIRTVGSIQVRFDEPMDAMLWFLELLSSEERHKFYPKSNLKRLVIRWYGKECERSFERFYKQLDEKGFIRHKTRKSHGRKGAHPHVVAITHLGRLLLKQIKQQRKEHLQLFQSQLDGLPTVHKRIVIQWLQGMAKAGISAMRDQAEGLIKDKG